MTTNETHAVLMTPESVAAYVKGVPTQTSEFDFLIGEWDAQATRYAPDGSVLLRHRAEWRARPMHGGRILLDDYVAYLPDGTAIGSFATLRTFSEETNQWEMTFLVAHQRQLVGSFVGQRVGDEMHLRAVGHDLEGKAVSARVRFFAITADSFEWEQELSIDGGATWSLDVSITAKRKSKAPPGV
jgi:hypothetical protein